MNDEFYMRLALRLAKRGEAWVSPNPMVGAVIVKENRIIAQGYHRKFGGDHAEIDALNRATEPTVGATIYVTLEPCTHHGKTPPCVQRVIACKPSRVVIGTPDPNPLVGGRGIETLQRHGITTTVGVLDGECRKLNERFFTFTKTGIPFVTLKFAQTIDGKIATASGQSRWISSGPSLRFAHRLRSSHDAVLIGIGTLLQDDPELTVRLIKGRNPVRIIVDSRLRVPLDARVLKNQTEAKSVIVTAPDANREKLTRLLDMGIETLVIGRDSDDRIDLKNLLRIIGGRNISSVLVEGGASIITSFFKEKLADRVVIVIAPKIMGKGIEAVGNMNITDMDELLRLSFRKITRSGDDLIVDGRIENGRGKIHEISRSGKDRG